MIKLLIISLCVYGVLGIPYQRFETFDDIENDSEIIDAAVPLPGTKNLVEKRLPVIRLTLPSGYLGNLYGNNNLAERTQLPSFDYYGQAMLPGVRNLDEKSIPDNVIARIMTVRHPKSEVEKVDV